MATAPLPATPTQKHLLALDIESEGPRLTDTVNAIGIAFVRVDFADPTYPAVITTALEKRNWAIKALPGETKDKQTTDEFWSKNQTVYAWILANQRDAREVMAEIRQWLLALVARYGLTPENTTLLSDCPHFDLGRTSFLGHKTGTWDNVFEFLETPMRFSTEDPSGRREEYDPDGQDFKRWLTGRGLADTVKHDHMPANDAEWNLYEWLYVTVKRHGARNKNEASKH